MKYSQIVKILHKRYEMYLNLNCTESSAYSPSLEYNEVIFLLRLSKEISIVCNYLKRKINSVLSIGSVNHLSISSNGR